MDKLVKESGPVYLGIDVHRKKYVIAAIQNGEVIKKATTPADPERFVECVLCWFAGTRILSVYEAGFSGLTLHRALVEKGVQNIVINPASLEVAANDRTKTDRRDAKKLAEQLAANRLKGIYIPTLEEELRRQVNRTREQVIKARNRVGNQIKSRLTYFGYLSSSDTRKMSGLFLKWVETLCLPEKLRFNIQLLISQWRLLNAQLKEILVMIQEQSFEQPELEQVYQSVPGVGPLSACILANELGDLGKRFKNQKSLYSYLGLTPSEHSSGEKIRRGSIDRQGASRLRHILVEIAWRAIKLDPALKQFFNGVATRRGKTKAIVAVARKITGRMRACFVQNMPYEKGLLI